jgi:hypothetical protein
MSFPAALKSKAGESQQRHPSQPAAEASATVDQPRVHTQRRRQETGQSDQASNESSDSQEEMFRAYTVAQQIMSELKDAASEEAKFVALAKIVFKLMNDNGK